ncbi:hypothetical protein [Maricaulis sp. CAU 1757]
MDMLINLVACPPISSPYSLPIMAALMSVRPADQRNGSIGPAADETSSAFTRFLPTDLLWQFSWEACMTDTLDFETALKDPASAFDKPGDVLGSSFSDDQKRQILKQWKYDASELEVATEENMGGGEPSMSRRVSLALSKLEEDAGEPPATASKQDI